MIIVNCANCHKQVDNIEQWQDPTNLDMVFMAYCHGSREETRIPYSWLSAGDVTIVAAEAFKETSDNDTKSICGN